ncbi:hypothetical protein RB653_003497 [Dictyostelium firmibasis]|uniref:Uncharacterized protein n=1 Tax=Dictyostelium firmibasis TaxID=79012 RepID=A0AAN7YZ59_9MYCE
MVGNTQKERGCNQNREFILFNRSKNRLQEINCAPSASTKISPSCVVYGFEPRVPSNIHISLINRKNGTRKIHVDDIKPYIEDRILFVKRDAAKMILKESFQR